MAQSELTPIQARLAELCITTKTLGKVTRREGSSPQTFRLVEVPRQLGVVDFATDECEFALSLHRQPGGITKPLSPFYFNFRNLSREVLETIGLVLAQLPIPDGIAFCTGIPKAGNAIAEAYSKVTGLPYRELLTKLGEGPDAKLIPHPEAITGEGEGILILDDLITGAHAKFAAGKEVTDLNYDVVGFAVVLDREQGGALQLEATGYSIQSAIRVNPLIDYYHHSGWISQYRHRTVKDYLLNSV